MRAMTADQQARRDRILAEAEAKGVSRKEVAEMAGFPGNPGEVRISRWARGLAVLPDDALERLEVALAAVPMPVAVPVDAGPVEQSAPADLGELARLAGEVPEDVDEKVLGAALARLHVRELIGNLLRLATSARSEQVRLKATSELLDRAEGRPIQTVREVVDRAPVEDAELLFSLERLVAQKVQAKIANAAAADLPALEAEAAGLAEEHVDAVRAAVVARREALKAAG